MAEIKINPLRKYVREGKMPHFFCPGCGCGQVLSSFLRSVDVLKIDIDRMVTVAGVGCSARIPVYMKTDTLHGVHGRTLAWATGIKLHSPETKVVVFAGDGDAVSIGGNHFIHAARRNLDVLMIVVNNFNFAMTGGQVAPMTPPGSVTMTTPYGSGEAPFDMCALAVAAGATYVARGTVYHVNQLEQLIYKALEHKGFSFVEAICQCPTGFGRRNKVADPVEMLLSQKELEGIWTMRKVMSSGSPAEVTEHVIDMMVRTINNDEFIDSMKDYLRIWEKEGYSIGR